MSGPEQFQARFTTSASRNADKREEERPEENTANSIGYASSVTPATHEGKTTPSANQPVTRGSCKSGTGARMKPAFQREPEPQGCEPTVHQVGLYKFNRSPYSMPPGFDEKRDITISTPDASRAVKNRRKAKEQQQ